MADAYTFHVNTSPEREYCTQYGENDFEFIQRLCSEDGISWRHRTDYQLAEGKSDQPTLRSVPSEHPNLQQRRIERWSFAKEPNQPIAS